MRLVAAKAINGGLAVSVVLEHVAHANSLTSGAAVSDLPCDGVSANEERQDSMQTVTRTRVEFEIPSPGLHLAINACAAAAVATSLGVPLGSVARSLSQFRPVDMRCRLEDVGPAGHVQILVINDCYNANPMSMESSLELLQSVNTSRRIAVLGDMLELGGISLTSHKEILQRCVDFKLDLVIVVGTCFSEAAEDFKGRDDIIAFRNTSSLTNHLARFISPGDAVLVKGSRGMRMEVLVDAIKSRAESWQSADHLPA
jgi:UDP-N-acetylmuramoyl-tripeptide--D-alanyl-D-alanine ligase